jgi:FkbM family methyltransferase
MRKLNLKAQLRKLASKMPHWLQQESKRIHYSRLIRSGRFVSEELEFNYLNRWLSEGDWALDIGANVGHYALRMSQLVGHSGRVIALEPIQQTFELLSANIVKGGARNVTLLNVAASNEHILVEMNVPKFATGLDNFYMASISQTAAGIPVFALAIDSLALQRPVALAKIDVEGHEMEVLEGMVQTLSLHRPALIVEGRSNDVANFLKRIGYRYQEFEGSPNRFFECVNGHN